MKIALMHFRVYETDGVSLEMDKWKKALENIGHEVIYISGCPAKDNDLFLEFLDYQSEYNQIIHKNAFETFTDFKTEWEFLDYIDQYSDKIYIKLKELIISNSIDLLVPNNISSLAYNIPVGIAVARLAKEHITEIIYHHHDFYWERKRYRKPTFKSINEYLFKYFPAPYNSQHCVINHIAKDELFKRKGIKATVIPNVFNFSQLPFVKDDYNNDLRKVLKIKEDDIVFLQATRIVERKAIELGFRIIEEIANSLTSYQGKPIYNNYHINKDTRIHFVLVGMKEMNDLKFKELNNLLQSSKVVIHYANDLLGHSREILNNQKKYSLWDFYTICDFISYTSVLEGWGNQLLEGLFAKKPILIYEYPVYKTDIKKYHFELVTITDEIKKDQKTGLYYIPRTTTKEKQVEIMKILLDKDKYNKIVDSNFLKAKTNLSYYRLEALLQELLDNI